MLAAILFALLPACPTEDSDYCAWDAAARGNGAGQSFVSIAGHVLHVEGK